MKILKLALYILLIILIVFAANRYLLKFEEERIRTYGQKINILGEEMNIVEMGEDNLTTIVLLPGYGTAAPGLDFYPLMKDLSTDFRLVAIEPFGYGDSSRTDRERSIENICEEIHLAIEKLGLKDYILCGHSISGIYSIYYLNKYPGEAKGFIGLDTSVPNQLKYQENIFYDGARRALKELGFIRLARFLYPQGFMASNDSYSDSIKKQIQYRVNRDFANETNINEGLNFEKNWSKVADLYYPSDIKTIFFLAKKYAEEENWRYIETKNATQDQSGTIYQMEGGHYIHRDRFKEISEIIRKEFLN